MTVKEELDNAFEKAFEEFEQNRMYPPGYGKESPMTRMSLRHTAALSHAEQFIFPSLKGSLSSRHRLEIERDLECLKEVKAFLCHVINEPRLPFGPDNSAENVGG